MQVKGPGLCFGFFIPAATFCDPAYVTECTLRSCAKAWLERQGNCSEANLRTLCAFRALREETGDYCNNKFGRPKARASARLFMLTVVLCPGRAWREQHLLDVLDLLQAALLQELQVRDSSKCELW